MKDDKVFKKANKELTKIELGKFGYLIFSTFIFIWEHFPFIAFGLMFLFIIIVEIFIR